MKSDFVRSITATASVALGLAIVQPVQAATFFCSAGDVQCLINAINQANANGHPQNTIRLEAGIYTLTHIDNFTTNIELPFPGDGPNGLPSITSTLTIKGAGANTTIIARDSGAIRFRLMYVAASGNLTLDGVTLTGGGFPFLDTRLGVDSTMTVAR